MSGPSLTKREAHHAIHEAAFAEAEELTRLLRQAALADDRGRALQLASVLIEHWQTRTLRHAEAEEQGWYRELVRERPELRVDIVRLTRDHDLLRRLLDEIAQIVAARGWVPGIIERFEAMLLVNAIHSREEEQRLLGGAAPAREEWEADTVEPSVDLDAGSDAHAVASVAELPLAIAFPELYRQGVEHLSAHGIHPGDLELTVESEHGGSLGGGSGNRARLRATFGHDFGEVLELPLPDTADRTAVERAFAAIATACERAVRSEYYEAMQIIEPGASGGRSKRMRFSLTVLGQPEEGREGGVR